MKADHAQIQCDTSCSPNKARTCDFYDLEQATDGQQIQDGHLTHQKTFFQPHCSKHRHQHSFHHHHHHHHRRSPKHYYYGAHCDWRTSETSSGDVTASRHEFFEADSLVVDGNGWGWNQASSCLSPVHSAPYVSPLGTPSPTGVGAQTMVPAAHFYSKDTEGTSVRLNNSAHPSFAPHLSPGDSRIKAEPPPSPLLTPDPSPGPPLGGHWAHPQSRRGNLQLWQFLMSLLDDPSMNGNFISWTGRGMEFKLIEPEEVARRWGIQKNRPAMNYDKLSRSLRYYYEKGIMQKVAGERYVYRFVSDPESLSMTMKDTQQPDRYEPQVFACSFRTTDSSTNQRKSFPPEASPFEAHHSASCARFAKGSGQQIEYEPLTCLQDLTSRSSRSCTTGENRCIHSGGIEGCVF